LIEVTKNGYYNPSFFLKRFLREKPFYEPIIERIYPLYKDIPSFEVFVMPAEEILAEKIKAIFKRDKPRDVYDLWFLLKKGTRINLSLINKKLHNKFNYPFFIKRLDEKRKTWKQDLERLIIGSLPSFEQIKKDITKYLKTPKKS